MRVAALALRTAVVHAVPEGAADPSALVLTDAPVALDTPLREYLEGKVRRTLEARGVAVVADPDAPPTVREAVAEVLSDAAALVPASRRLARHLHAVQTGRNPAGLLLVALGAVDGDPCACIVKLEPEEGLRFRIVERRGRRAVDLEFLRDLALTAGTRIFKTALLGLGAAADPLTLHGRVSDDQRGWDEGRGVAAFFLHTFLGCRLETTPEKATLDFVQAAEAFFGRLPTAERKGRYQVALLAALQDNRLDLSPREFAETSLRAEDRAGFLEQVAATGVDPEAAFEKDTALVRVRGFRMTFESGMVLVGSREDLAERVAIRPEERPGVEVNDAIRALTGR